MLRIAFSVRSATLRNYDRDSIHHTRPLDRRCGLAFARSKKLGVRSRRGYLDAITVGVEIPLFSLDNDTSVDPPSSAQNPIVIIPRQDTSVVIFLILSVMWKCSRVALSYDSQCVHSVCQFWNFSIHGTWNGLIVRSILTVPAGLYPRIRYIRYRRPHLILFRR